MADDDAEILPEQPLGTELPDAEGIIFPQLLGEAYRRMDDFRQLDLPILTVTSEIWHGVNVGLEIASYLRAGGSHVIAPYSLAQTESMPGVACQTRVEKHKVSRLSRQSGRRGFRPGIFKRFTGGKTSVNSA